MANGDALPGMTIGDVLAFKHSQNALEHRPKRPKKLRYLDLAEHDRKHDDSTIRLLEMTVDHLLPDQGYALQFWSDVRLYGVDEAGAYLKNTYSAVDYAEYDTTVAQIRKAVESGQMMADEDEE